ncbi:CLUMA_CG000633, isoform A [Clunio marinus]|uniref:CLUMA_CG000633, isoform A n=1 Tax=Clunio marinus TaxID=568069 RepID=A0A1J1HGW9_9DIPT|nr:CLUMA_CG000633, isoform A [Clunio marinus]
MFMLSSNMCFFTKYQSCTHNEERKEKLNQNMSYENDFLCSSVDVWGSLFTYSHAEVNPITQKKFSTYGRVTPHSAKPHCHQSCFSPSLMYVSRRCSARDKHYKICFAPKN